MITYHRLVGTWKHRVDTYIVLTEFMREKMAAAGLPPHKLVVKPNFLDPDPGPRSEETDFALFVGRLSKEKGIRTLLAAWESLSDIRLKIIGDGPLKTMVEATVAAGSDSPIELLGWREHDEVLEVLRKARILIVPSEWYEGFPLTMVEALACGVPIVGSRIGGVGEIIETGSSGLLFDPGNTADLVEKILRLWHDEQLRADCGRRARSQYEAGFTAEKNYAMLMEIVERSAR
jgi:glycosyltransferase involved in cell wall biosynthesis